MKQQAVHSLQGALLDILVGAVHGVAGLKAHNGVPSQSGYVLPGLGRSAVVGRDALLQRWASREHGYLSSQEHVAFLVEVGDPRVLLFRCAIDLLRLFLPVPAELPLQGEDADDLPAFERQRGMLPLLELGSMVRVHPQGYGKGPGAAVCQEHVS